MKISILLFIGIISLNVYTQTENNKNTDQLNLLLKQSSDKEEILVWVFFNDKGKTAAFKLDNPEKVISEKSLKRRSKVLPPDKLISNEDIPVNIDYIDKVKTFGFRLKQRSRWFNGISGFATKQEIALISDLPFVKKLDVVEKFRKDYGAEVKDESDLLYKNISSQPVGTHNLNYGNSFTQLDQIKVPDVQDLGYSGRGVTICVMDAGFDNLSHEAFDSLNVIAEWNFVDNSSDISGHYHGTNTLSIIGGFKEGELIGPAYGSNYILAVTEDDPGSETPIEEDNWIAAMEWADSIGVDITSTSLGYLTFDAPYTSYTWEDMDGKTARITIAAERAAGLGIVVVNSAGNNGYNSKHNTLNAPADGDSVFTIGAVASSGIRSGFSSVGPTIDGRIKPDLMAMGFSVYAAGTSSLTSYGFVSGTSYSCPLAAGCAALLLSYQPSLTPMEVLNLFRQTASQSNNPDNLMGWGIINTYEALQLIPVVSVELNDYHLYQNYPNPFNPSTTIRYSLPRESRIKIALYNILGNLVEILFDGEQTSGIHQLILNAKDLSSGVYFISMEADHFNKSIKISLIK